VGGQRFALAALPPGKTRYPLYRRLGGPQGRSGRVRKISPPPGFDSRTVRPVASRYTDYAIPAPCIYYNRPDLIVGDTDSTQGILCLVVTGNVQCRPADWIQIKIIVVMSLHVYYHSYLVHVSSAVTTKSVVSYTARKNLSKDSLLPSQPFLSTCSQRDLAKYCPRTQLGLAS
jgi:hypothetical protein